MRQYEETKYISTEVQSQELYDYARTLSYVKSLHFLIGTKVTEQFTNCKDVRLCHMCAKAFTTEQPCLDCHKLLHR